MTVDRYGSHWYDERTTWIFIFSYRILSFFILPYLTLYNLNLSFLILYNFNLSMQSYLTLLVLSFLILPCLFYLVILFLSYIVLSYPTLSPILSCLISFILSYLWAGSYFERAFWAIREWIMDWLVDRTLFHHCRIRKKLLQVFQEMDRFSECIIRLSLHHALRAGVLFQGAARTANPGHFEEGREDRPADRAQQTGCAASEPAVSLWW